MLNALHLGNFKAFADSQRIPIRPLTLIYGANSAGKSSIIHSLILAHHAIHTGELDVHRTTVGGEAVDLGGFRQYVNRRDASRRVEWAVILDAKDFGDRLAELFAPVRTVTVHLELGIAHTELKRKRPGIDPRTGKAIEIEEPTGELVPVGKPGVQAFTLSADDRLLLSMSRRPSGVLQLDKLDHEHPVFREAIRAMVMLSSTTEELRPEDFDGLNDAVAALVPEIVATASRFLPDGLAKAEGLSGSLQLFFTISKGRRKEDLAGAIRSFLPRKIDEMLKGVAGAVAGEIGRLQYLGPLRSYPPRHLAFAQHQDQNWFAGGGYAWDVVRRDARVRGLVNQWLNSVERLQTPYELVVRSLVGLDQLEAPIWEALERLSEDGLDIAPDYDDKPEPEGAYSTIKDFEKEVARMVDAIRSADTEKLDELILVDRRSNTVVSHRDVGIGISQVLPVLVGSYVAENRLVAIEQPEIHLHPKLQAELGDVFITSALGDRRNTFMLETHSEHLLLRIMKRMRQTFEKSLPDGVPPVHPQDVSVLYVEPDGNRSIVREMPLNERGELVKAWPGGFFEEGLREVF